MAIIYGARRHGTHARAKVLGVTWLLNQGMSGPFDASQAIDLSSGGSRINVATLKDGPVAKLKATDRD
jgi:hypothetical protein